MTENQYDTILDALKAARDKGFECRFVVEKGALRCLENNEIFPPSRVTIEAYHRVEGPSDPDESAILYLIETKSGIKGTLIDAFGTYANPEIAELISSIPIDRGDIGSRYENKRCLNCGTILTGLYCSHCGQRDEHLHEPFWKLAGHFIGDLFHFDSKFSHTLYPLLVKPGFLTNEFMAGKRARYMKPVSLYFFISVVFFLLFFMFSNPAEEIIGGIGNINVTDRLDSAQVAMITDSVSEKKAEKVDSLITIASGGKGLHLSLTGQERLPKTIEAYNDSIRGLPKNKRPSLMIQFLERKQIEMEGRDQKEVLKAISENILHNIPKLMFFLLPVFALLLKLLYVRKKVYFVDHAIFTLHYHSFIFLLLTVVMLPALLFTIPYLYLITFLLILIYLLAALKNVYRQSWPKTSLKFTILVFLYTFLGIISGGIYIFISAILL